MGTNTHYGEVVRYYGARKVTEERRAIKVNLYVFTPRWHAGGVEVRLHSFLTSALDGDKCWTLRLDRYSSGKDTRYPSNRGLVGPQDLSVICGDDENILFLPGFGPRIVQSLAWSLYFHRNSGSPYRYFLLPGAELPSWKFWPSQRPLSTSLDPGRRLSSFWSSFGRCPVWCYPPTCTWVFLVIFWLEVSN